MEGSPSSIEPTSMMKRRFYMEIKKHRLTAARNTVCLTDERYQQLIEEVKSAKVAAKKVPRHYWLLKRYDVMDMDHKPKLIRPVQEGCSTVQLYASESELFEILHASHVAMGHGGRDRLLKDLSPKYKNITRHDIKLFLEACPQCQQKHRSAKRGLKMVITSECTSRCQVDLIDFQAHPDGDLNYILVYQELASKFTVLKALKTRQAEEAAYNLTDIFALLGAPSVLQSGNGREFASEIVSSLKYCWPQLHIVHGKVREESDDLCRDIENSLTNWMRDENSGHWGLGLRFVQLMRNQVVHEATKVSPYETLFGSPIKVGLSTSSLPRDALDNIRSEEELQDLAIGT